MTNASIARARIRDKIHNAWCFFLFFHVNKWYIFSAYSTYSFTVHFSLDLNNYKWTSSTLKNGTNVSHAFVALFISRSLFCSLVTLCIHLLLLIHSLGHSLAVILSNTFSHSPTHRILSHSRVFLSSFHSLVFFSRKLILVCVSCVTYKRLYIWFRVSPLR